jgi:hypothetical protein
MDEHRSEAAVAAQREFAEGIVGKSNNRPLVLAIEEIKPAECPK